MRTTRPKTTQLSTMDRAFSPAQEKTVEALVDTKPRRGGDRPSPADRSWIPAFLATLRETGNVRLACEAAGGLTRAAAYRAKSADPEGFGLAWQAALDDALDNLEQCARDRAIEGSWGRLLQFLLAAHRPEIYGHRARVEHSGPEGAAIPLAVIDRILHEDSAQFPDRHEDLEK